MNPDNQRTLAFVGAGVVGFAALLFQFGIVGPVKKDPPTSSTASPPASSAPQLSNGRTIASAPPASTQSADAGQSSSIVQINGNNNVIER